MKSLVVVELGTSPDYDQDVPSSNIGLTAESSSWSFSLFSSAPTDK
jgi:hypothetical protein